MNDNQEVIGTLEDIKYLLQKPKNIEVAKVMIDATIIYLQSRQTSEGVNNKAPSPLTNQEHQELKELKEHLRTAHNLHITERQLSRVEVLENRKETWGVEPVGPRKLGWEQRP